MVSKPLLSSAGRPLLRASLTLSPLDKLDDMAGQHDRRNASLVEDNVGTGVDYYPTSRGFYLGQDGVKT